MFRAIAITVLLATLAAIAYLYRGRLPYLMANASQGIKAMRVEALAGDWRKLVYFLTTASFGILILTGFIPVFFGAPVSGLVLVLHAFAAPVFAVGLAIVAVLWAEHHRFDRYDWQRLRELIRPNAGETKANVARTGLGQKVSFWLVLLLSLPVIVSILLTMYRFFGTEGQETLLNMHGYSALLLVIAVVMRFYLGKLGDE